MPSRGKSTPSTGAAEVPSTAGSGSRLDRVDNIWLASAVFVVLLGLYLPFGLHTAVQMNDTRSASAAAWNLAARGELAFPEQWPVTREIWSVEGQDGRHYSNRFPGVIAWGVPFFFFQENVRPSVHAEEHYLFIDFRAGAVAGAVATALGVSASFLLYGYFVSRLAALGAALLTGLGTSLWSVASTALWPHGLTHLSVTLALLAVASKRPWLLAIATVIALTARPHVAIGLLPIGLWLLIQRRWPEAMGMAGGALLGMGLVSTYSFVVFDTALPAAGYAVGELGRLTTDLIQLAEFVSYGFASPGNGLFIYSSFLLLLLPFSVRAWRISPGWVRSAAVGAVSYAIFQAVATNFVGGDQFFSYRVQLESLALMAPLLILCWDSGLRTERWLKWLFSAFAVSAVGIHAVGASLLTIDPDAAAGYREVTDQRRTEILDGLGDPEGE